MKRNVCTNLLKVASKSDFQTDGSHITLIKKFFLKRIQDYFNLLYYFINDLFIYYVIIIIYLFIIVYYYFNLNHC